MLQSQESPGTIWAVITSIQPPTLAVKLLARNKQLKTIVVADKKTPAVWQENNVKFLSVPEQQQLDFPLLRNLPWNHYSRKMLGYIYAIQKGAAMIYDTDDDNIPTANWQFPAGYGCYQVTRENLSFINVYQYFTRQKVWPRGFPLNLVNRDYTAALAELSVEPLTAGIDAIYRLLFNDLCIFEKKPPLLLNKGTICPFNSQNTLFSKDTFPLLYIPATVTFRFCDILRGLVAQPILWTKNLHLGFTAATVRQIRNPHDYLRDFESEVPMYLNAEKLVAAVAGKVRSSYSLTENLWAPYELLLNMNIVSRGELDLLHDWLAIFS